MAIADEIVAANYVRHLPGGKEIRGREAYKQYVTKFMTTFPDTRWNMDIMMSKGDYVVVRYSGSGTHTGEGMGTPPGKDGKSRPTSSTGWLVGSWWKTGANGTNLYSCNSSALCPRSNSSSLPFR